MEKVNFGALLANLVNDSQAFPSVTEDIENCDEESITPPPEFDEVEKSPSRVGTLRSSTKLKNVLSFRREKS